MKLFRITEIVYLVVAVLSVVEVIRKWDVDRSRAYLFLFFAVVSILMYFFRRYYRKRFEQRKNNDDRR
ncbi:hypothetical protein [Sinomicrobium weinanense]|uniref:Uncharacterized protein n=1 Tax=Sinomicrobium weinanense TaxID=2842200 RepID=A0A926Q3G1_9FLAO|nr:hypothetical protein [Sinomicrobium weinanense]MBC9797572.1 hypothetical protein [Sinomicrobium weinanense]MBU3123639.1 hypothetical protein [Sinomicrobium weinanense]